MPNQARRCCWAVLVGCASLLFTETSVRAQPANDECAGAIPVMLDTEVPFDTFTATRSTDPWPCVDANVPGGDVQGDVWFSFTAPSAGVALVVVCSMPFDPDYYYQAAFLTALSSCGGVELACDPVGDDDIGSDPFCAYSRVYVPVSEGQSIRLRIAGPGQGPFGPSPVIGTFTITMVSPPTNDTCDSAIELLADIPVSFSNLAAATETTVPCGTDTAGGVKDVWFRFTATESGVAVFGAGGTMGVTLSAFDSCGSAPIACSTNNVDSGCVNCSGSLLSLPVTDGQVVLLRIAGTRGPYNYFHTGGDGGVGVSIVQPPPNDLRANATPLVAGDNPFTNRGALTDGSSTCSGVSGFTANDVWFVFEAAADNLVTLVVRGSGNYLGNGVMSVIDQATDAELVCSRSVSRFVGGFSYSGRIDARFNAVAGRSYLVRIAGDGGDSGDGILTLSTSAPILSCLTQPAGAYVESEACGQQTNNGCRFSPAPLGPPVVEELPSPNITVWGSSYANAGTRDTDWYRFTLDNPAVVTINMTAEFPVRVSLMVDTCWPEVIATDLELTRCAGPATISLPLPAGSFGVVIYPDSDDPRDGLRWDWPCALPTHYILTIDSQFLGACCTPHGCSLTTASDCAAQFGRFAGEGTDCPSAIYTQAAGDAPFEDISANGIRIVLTNNSGRSVDIGFEFEFYGRRYSSIGISDNGYLAFGNQPLGVALNTNRFFTTPPNNAIFALWDDLNPTGGGIYVRTDGAPGSRRFIASWQHMPGGFYSGTDTFQVVLFEASNRIELRYGEIVDRGPVPPFFPGDVSDITVGLKDSQGLDTLQIPSASFFPPSPRSISLTPTAAPGACSNAPCPADYNNDGLLNSQDFFNFLTAFFDSRADFNNDGVTNSADFFDFLGAFFTPCP